MIICFYPGAGGNRFYRSFSNQEYTSLGQSYDHTVKMQLYQDRYPMSADHSSSPKPYVLTHCMNTPLVKNIWPDHEIYVIMFDMQPCLRREWILEGHDRYLAKKVDMDAHTRKQELYDAIKDPSWPTIASVSDIEELPAVIKNEFQARWQEQNPQSPTGGELVRQKYNILIDSALAAIAWHREYYQRWPVDITCADHVIDLTGESEFARLMRKELALYCSQLFDDCWDSVHG